MLKSREYLVVTVAQAREKCFEARELPASEVDPVQKRRDDRQAKVIADGHNLGAVAQDWWARGNTQAQANITYSRPCAG